MVTPLLTATPSLSTTYNVGMAETFSWVPIDGAGRPLFARAMYLVGAGLSLDVGDIDINLADVENLVTISNTKLDALTAKQDTTNYLLSAQLGQQGFDFIESGTPYSGPYTTIQIVSAAKITAISGPGITPGNITNYELPVNFSFNGHITNIELTYGAAIAYKL